MEIPRVRPGYDLADDQLTALLRAARWVVVTVGPRTEPARLDEPFAGRETAARARLPIGDLPLAVLPSASRA